MRAIQSPSTDPRFNLALEQYIFDQMPRNRSYLMLWRNDQTIVVGKHQDTFAEINADYVRANQIQVVRRLSGGRGGLSRPGERELHLHRRPHGQRL